MSSVGIPIYSQSGVGDENLLRVQRGANSAPPPELAYDLPKNPSLSAQAAAGNTPAPDPSTAYKYLNTPLPDALFSGIKNAPPPTTIGQRLAQMGQPPASPQMRPERAAAEAAYEKDLDPLDKTKPQYHMGIGGRILGTLANLFSGGIGGAVRGFVRPGLAPVYVGRGATNSRFDQDEEARFGRLQNEAARLKLYDQDYDQSERQYKNDRTQYDDRAAMAQHQDASEINQYNAGRAAQQQRDQEELQRETQLAKTLGNDAQQRLNILTTLDLPLTPAERQAFIESGKLPDNASTAGAIRQRQQATQQRQQAIRHQHRARPKVAVPSVQPVQSAPNSNPYR